MLITIKTITKDEFKIKGDSKDTIRQLKETIEQEKRIDVDCQKLIFAGKILQDDQILADLNYKENAFIALVVSPQKKRETSASKCVQQHSISKGTKLTNQPSQSSEVASAQSCDSVVNEMLKMGFQKENVIAALKKADNNPDVAVAMLLNKEEPNKQCSTRQRNENDNNVTDEGKVSSVFSQPVFLNLKAAYQENPSKLEELLRQLGQTNPEFMKIVEANQERFLEMLNIAEGEEERVQPAVQNVDQTETNPEESQAIQRIVAMGFPEDMVREAYLVCDKNEMLAINMLLEKKE